MALSGVDCSVKMSVHEGIAIEPTRIAEGAGTEQSAGWGLGCKGGGQGDGGKRTSWVAASDRHRLIYPMTT